MLGVTIQPSLVTHIGSRVAQMEERTRDVHICKDVELKPHKILALSLK